jgi:hypothetical protein
MAPAPSLHGRYPLPRYYEPVRLPAAAADTVMLSRAALGLHARPCIAGPPRFLDRSVPTRRPLTPRRARRVHVPVASTPVAGFVILGSLATLDEVHEADSGSLALRLAGSLPEASPAGLLQLTLGSLPAERAIRRITSFQVTRSARLGLAHPKSKGQGPKARADVRVTTQDLGLGTLPFPTSRSRARGAASSGGRASG